MSRWTCAAVCLLAATVAPGASATEWVTPTVTVSRLGGFNWADATQMGHFVLADGAAMARQRTNLYMAYDAANFHVGISAEESDMGGLRLAFARGRPQQIRDADSVSIYIKSGGVVHEFTVAADGRLDEVRWPVGKEHASWTAGATWTIDRPDEWRGVLTVPLRAVGLANVKAGDRVDFAAVRREQPFDEVSGWPKHQGGKDPPQEWGSLVFGKQGGAYVANFGLQRPNPGPSKFGYRLRPLDMKCRGEILVSEGAGPRTLPTRKVEWVQPGGDGWRVFHYSLAPGTPVKLQTILYVNEQVFHASAVLPVPFPSLVTTITESLTRDPLSGRSASPALAHATGDHRKRLESLLASARSALADAPSGKRSRTLETLTDQAEKLT